MLWGDGSPSREFLYVDDCVDGARARRRALRRAEPVNLGTGDEISIRELAEPIADVTGFEGEHRLGHARCRTGSRAAASTRPARASSSASQATTPLRDGLERTVAWYRSRRTAHAGA